MARHFTSADGAITYAIDQLKRYGVTVDSGSWQGVPTEGKPDLVTKELLDLDLSFPIPPPLGSVKYPELDANEQIKPNLPWAEAHFQERVSRNPTNPGEEYMNWPWWRGQAAAFEQHPEMGDEGSEPRFSHTYQERFWPKYAGESIYERDNRVANRGVRYEFGDLDSVIDLLRRDPQSRQAYFPIFFPEDTGAVHGGRIPCSLGYHFLLRGGLLHCWYDIRSCDAVRHFRDDLYLAVRLVHWVLEELVEGELRSNEDQVWVDVNPGTLFFKAHSFHVHMGDYHLLP